MDEQGYLLFVLHTHMPFVRDSSREYPAEENWLFEAITECYIPLIEVFCGLIRDGVDFRITLSLTPCLSAMLADPLLQERYLRYLDGRIRLAEREADRLRGYPAQARLAGMYRERFVRWRTVFGQRWGRDLNRAFGFLADSGKVDILASGATHAYYPLWGLYPKMIALQTLVGVQQYRKCLGRPPTGFWLPECGFAPGVDGILRDSGIHYFFLDAHGITNGHPRPRYGVHAPVYCPSGVAAFGRDWSSHDLVWLKDRGYPGDPFYLDYNSDIGYSLPQDYLAPFTHQPGPDPVGIKYARNGKGGDEVYVPDIAFSRCDEHASHFMHRCCEQVHQLHAALGRRPVMVAMFDTEHFGHWWHEGPIWLDLVLRKMAYDQKTVKLSTALDYLKANPTHQIVSPSMSSWGYQGHSETWLMGRNHWIYPQLYQVIEAFQMMLAQDPAPRGDARRMYNQYLRELLMAQSSDWAFIMHSQTAQQYAEQRVREHLANMAVIFEQVTSQALDIAWLAALEARDNIFLDMDLLEVYMHSGGPLPPAELLP